MEVNRTDVERALRQICELTCGMGPPVIRTLKQLAIEAGDATAKPFGVDVIRVHDGKTYTLALNEKLSSRGRKQAEYQDRTGPS